jgi:hypothetical protein
MMSKLIGGVLEGGKVNWGFSFWVYLRLSQCLLDWGLLIISIESLLLVVGPAWEKSLPSISNQLMGVSPLLLQVQLTIPLYANHGGKEKMLSSYAVIGNISLTYTF